MSDIQFKPQPTPNPNSYKFVADRCIVEGSAKAYYDAQAAQAHPLANALFALPGVVGVLLLDDFCSVNHDGSQDWDKLAPKVEELLRSHFKD